MRLPDETQTRDPDFRRILLYSTELQEELK